MIAHALTAILVLSLPESELADRRAWFDATILGAALEPCKSALPSRANAFQSHSERWLKTHAAMLQRGEDSFRAEAGEAFQPEAFDLEGAQKQFTELLRSYTKKRQHQWCEQQLQIVP